MPYRLIAFPAPRDGTIFVFKELPPGFTESKGIIYNYREAFREDEGLYYCDFCEGWIVGEPNAFYENTLNQNLIGRRGTAYYCRRCGKEIAFEIPRYESDWREKPNEDNLNLW